MPEESVAAKASSSSEEGVGGGGVLQDTLRQRARLMRKNPTEPERRLWQALKGSQLEAWKFRRQQVIEQPPTPQPITFPGVAEIEFGKWPLEKADPGAVEAMFRHEIVRLQESK